jgi:hypothetical protein
VKTCFKCGLEKPLDDFYVHKMMGDGHLGKCKDCARLDMRVDRITKPRVREYDRERSKAWDKRFPQRATAHNRAAAAVKSGKIAKPAFCEGCGLPKRLEKHHPDYSKPLLVVWFCKPCHAIADKIRRRLESA